MFIKLLKSISVLSIILLSSVSGFAETIHGTISIDQGIYYITPLKSTKRFMLKSTSIDAAEQIKRLKNKDFLVGNGDIKDTYIVLLSVDFVGLRELIGVWMDELETSLFNFHDFSNVSLYYPGGTKLVLIDRLQYSIAPGSNDEWKVFFTDANHVRLATLSLEKNQASLQFYDTQSGEISKTVELERVSSYR